MKLVVFGSTGGIGAQVVEQALAVGHEVTAVARRPSAVTLRHDCLRVVQGDVLDAASVHAAIRGQEVVVSAVGARDRSPTTVYSAGVTHMLEAMQAEGLRRLFCVSASGLDPEPLWQRLIAKPMLWLILKNMYTDLVLMENEVSASGLEWTILRPPQLTDAARTGHYQVAVNHHLGRVRKISRADVADYIVRHLKDETSYGGVVELAY